MAEPKLPGPDHPISVTPAGKTWRVVVGGEIVAESSDALDLKEATYPVVHYFPRADVKMAMLNRTAHHTRCPYKGEASYYSIAAGGKVVENAVWSYETPYPAVAAIKDHVAFYPDRVDRIEVV